MTKDFIFNVFHDNHLLFDLLYHGEKDNHGERNDA
nr:MAG TPA: hypothetical protein [Caudoviricetes sp.]